MVHLPRKYVAIVRLRCAAIFGHYLHASTGRVGIGTSPA